MLYKCLVFCLTAMCGTLIGLEYRRRLTMRVKSLEMFRDLFKEIQSYVSHSGLSLNEIISCLAIRHPNHIVFLILSENVQNQSFYDRMRYTLSSKADALCLTSDDCSSLVDLSGRLGRFDTDTELETLEMIDERLGQMIEDARTRLHTDGKIYTALGCSCGIIVGLLVI